jgi:hypothetical protein
MREFGAMHRDPVEGTEEVAEKSGDPGGMEERVESVPGRHRKEKGARVESVAMREWSGEGVGIGAGAHTCFRGQIERWRCWRPNEWAWSEPAWRIHKREQGRAHRKAGRTKRRPGAAAAAGRCQAGGGCWRQRRSTDRRSMPRLLMMRRCDLHIT